MAEKEKKHRNKKRRSDSDGVTVKRSYYSFAKYYPGGGSSQKYRRVMKETKDEMLPIKAAFAVIGLVLVVFIGFFMTTVGLEISGAPTTEPTSVTENSTETTQNAVIDTTKPKEEKTTKEKTESTTIEEPEREINVTSRTEVQTEEELTEEVTEIFTGY